MHQRTIAPNAFHCTVRFFKGDPSVRSELTPTEWAIVAALRKGMSNKEIAADLELHVQTVKNQLSIVYAKLGVRNRLELGMYLVKNNLGEP